ncbi:uncharacterized protein LOC141630369 [Silene latifolia]|uniref:uncharacterized protein LOC141630369 n=1 Tax=Silene latifolia TaxID=37657 RepID=UPI003D78533D
MASASNTISIPTTPMFGGENYDYWCIKIKLFLRANALWEIVESGIQQQKQDVVYTEAQLKKINENELKDAKALSYILNAVTEVIFPRIMRATTAKEAWDSLQQEFQGDIKIRTIRLNTLRKDFENMKMKDDEDIKYYTSRLMEVVNQMKMYGEDITDIRIVQKILGTLTKRFDTIITVIEESKDISKLSVSELTGSLLAHDQKFKKLETSSENAFPSKHKSKTFNSKGGWKKNASNSGASYKTKASQSRGKYPSCGTCGKTNHAEKDCYFKGKPQCRHCNRFGHFEKDCRQKARESKPERNFLSSNQEEDYLFYARQASISSHKEKWLIDSGCTNHMTNNSNIFCKLDTSVNVRFGWEMVPL